MVGPPLGPSKRNRNATVATQQTSSVFAQLHASTNLKILRAI